MNTAVDGLSVDKVHVWRGDRHVLKGVSLSRRRPRIAAHPRPERHRQDYVAAGRVRPASAGAGAGVVARAVDFEHSGRISGRSRLCLARTGPQGRSDCPGESALCGGTEAPRRPRKNCAPAWNRTGVAACADLPARVLSAGQRRRVAMARVLAMSASLWLLDEPFTNLDAAGAELISGLLRSHVEQGRSGDGGRAP